MAYPNPVDDVELDDPSDVEVRVVEPRDGSISMTDDSGLEIIPDNEIYEGSSSSDENEEGFIISGALGDANKTK